MADGRHFENSFIAIKLYLSRKSSDLNEIWYADADCVHNKMLKFSKFKMADGRHIENRLLAISQRMIIRLTQNFVR